MTWACCLSTASVRARREKRWFALVRRCGPRSNVTWNPTLSLPPGRPNADRTRHRAINRSASTRPSRQSVALALPAPKTILKALDEKLQQVAVTAAWLSGLDGDQPARAELEIQGCQAAASAPGTLVDSRWLLAEAWWAEKFPTPTYSEIVSWSFGVLPATLIAHFDRRFRRVRCASERSVLSSASSLKVLCTLGPLLWKASCWCSRWR